MMEHIDNSFTDSLIEQNILSYIIHNHSFYGQVL